MENRFGIKDFFLLLFLGALIVVVLLQMKQNDRQFQVLQAIRDQNEDQMHELGSLQRLINRAQFSGIAQPATAPTTQESVQDPFARIRQTEAMPGYSQGDWLIDSGPNSDKITPLVSGDVFGADVQTRVLESLLTRDEVTLDWQPVIAKSWQIDDNSQAYQQYVNAQKAKGISDDARLKDPNLPWAIKITFQLRPNVTFSDGVPLTAQDVVWTFNWIMNEKVDAPRERAFYDKISSVKAVGDAAVVFTFRELYFDSMGLAGGMAIMPSHFYGKYSPEDFNKSTGLLLGSGPYRMLDPTSSTGSSVVLIRNERYWGEPPAFDRVIYRIIDNDLARLTTFRNGDIDIFNAQPEQYNKLVEDQDLVARTQHFAYDTAVGGYRYIAWNEQRDGKPTFFADKRVRRAMTMLIDRPRICRDIMFGFATPITGPFNPLGKQYDHEIQPLPLDVASGQKALLKAAGFVDDGSGALKGPGGAPFQFKLTYPAGVSNYDQIALFLKDSFAKAGITLVPDALDWSVFSERLKNRDFDAISLGWSQGIEDDIYQMFNSSQIGNEGDDFMSYKNPELDKLIEEARQTVDEAKRIPLWRQCHRIINEDQPYTFLFTRKSLVFIDGRIKNVHQVPLGLNSDMEWFVPKGLQKWEK